MKRSGRSIKQRLYGLKHLPSRLRRARYFRGHGVHSPYIYNIVRQVFMRRTFIRDQHPLYDALCAMGCSAKRAMQIENLATHCNYATWSIDSHTSSELVILTTTTRHDAFEEYAHYAATTGATLCIMLPYDNAQRWSECKRLIEAHPSTTVDNRAYLLLFNNHLPKQRFRL